MIIFPILKRYIFILVYVLVAGRSSETGRTAAFISINKVDALLEFGTSDSLAVVNVLLREDRLSQNYLLEEICPKTHKQRKK